MRILLLLACLTACEPAPAHPPDRVSRWVDSTNGVICYFSPVNLGYSISCLR